MCTVLALLGRYFVRKRTNQQKNNAALNSKELRTRWLNSVDPREGPEHSPKRATPKHKSRAAVTQNRRRTGTSVDNVKSRAAVVEDKEHFLGNKVNTVKFKEAVVEEKEGVTQILIMDHHSDRT